MTDAAESARSPPTPPSRCSRRAPCPRPRVRSPPVPYPRRSRVHASPPPGSSGARRAWGARRPGTGAGATGWGLRRTIGRPPRATPDALGEGPPGNPRTGQTSTYSAYPPPVGLIDLGGTVEGGCVSSPPRRGVSVCHRTCRGAPRWHI
ncbi:neural Wiskott-Aldrich syndrome protein-like isoform X2 [Phyllostomus discolor]|uniref:Neural Wiskott-Aldrich syndrome protein-like isoform X2 n=1 Tax=Phyllostomus discolor TaxID=89673 RepID=A0A7E6E7H1_9CHIR|nr:neural Wiskott-Aldrich syndrome protein-like isoform X2 [Phyllostomus discolor]